MNPLPKWYLPVAVAALVWNLVGCVVYLAGVTVSAEDIANMSAAQQTLYASRTWWTVSATAVGVWGGAGGCLGLVLRKRWALPFLIASLAGLIVQDFALFVLNDGLALAGPAAVALQTVVLLISIGLVYLARHAGVQGWIGGGRSRGDSVVAQ